MHTYRLSDTIDELLIAESPDLQDYRFGEGFHGTDDLTAFQIIQNGFSRDHFDDTCFAPPDDRGLAIDHATKNAKRHERDRYALLKAHFPLTTISQGLLGGPCIRFYGEELTRVSIVALGIFSAADGKLLATYDELQLNEICHP